MFQTVLMPAITTRIATEEDFESIFAFDGQIFGESFTDEERTAVRPTLELDRFHLAFDGDKLIAMSGLYSLELTVPGGAIVPAGGVSWVAVAPTHRRQGVLTRLMGELHEDIDAHDEPLAILTASEGGIYDRFGYGVATQLRITEVDRRRTSVQPEHQPAPGDVMMTTYGDPRLLEIFDRFRRSRSGEIARHPERYALVLVSDGPGISVAIHADGYAAWKITPKWHDGHPAHEMSLLDMIAITPEAHAALWHTVLSVDLVGPITSRVAMALDDTLPYLVTDPRAVRTTNLNDNLWVHIRDVKRALEARTYGSSDEFVIDVDLGDRSERRRLIGTPDSADSTASHDRIDLEMDRASLGAIYLGGVRPSVLVRAGRIRAANADVVRRADTFFSADRLPHCTTGF